jgi:hypothetical protein
MSQRKPHCETVRETIRNLVLVAVVVMTVAATTGVALAQQTLPEGVDVARCKRASDLKHWHCETICTDGTKGIASCPSMSAWGACGRQVLHRACGISDEKPTVACLNKVVLAGRNLDQLKSACEQSYLAFDEQLEGPFETFPGLVYRPGR